MEVLFAHIDQAKYLLTQLFESGFLSARNVEDELANLALSAKEMGFARGSGLLRALAKEMTAFRGSPQGTQGLMQAYSGAWSYYELVLKLLIIQSIANK